MLENPLKIESIPAAILSLVLERPLTSLLKKPCFSPAIFSFPLYLSKSCSIRFTETRVETPFSCMVIPYSRSAAVIVPRL